jgi:hypothetical protein
LIGASQEHRMAVTYRVGRLTQVIYVAVFVMSVCFGFYYLMRWLRGDADGYPNEVVGGLAINTTMALLTSSQIARNRLLRWILGGLTALAVPLTGVVIFGDVRLTPLMITGLVVSVGSVVWAAYVVWPRSGGFAALSTTPATLKQRRALLTSIALVHVGLALFLAAAVDFTRGPWDATAVGVLTIVMFLGGAAAFLIRRRRLRA